MNESNSAILDDEPIIVTKKNPESKKNPKILPPYHVILLNDDDHTAKYVVELLRAIFGYEEQKGEKLAKEVHDKKKAIVWTGSKELGELKQEQIQSFGADKLVARCKGSMTAILEPSV